MEDNIFSPQISVFESFAANVDSSRTNMSAKQILQTVVGDHSQIPFIINRNFKDLSVVDSPFIKFAEDDGYVLYNANNILLILYWNEVTKGRFEGFYIPKNKELVNNSLPLRYSIKDKVFKKGDCLFDYTNQNLETNIPRIGYRTKIAYTSFFGFTAEDALVISQSFANRTTIDYSETLYIPITPEIKFSPNEHGRFFYTEGEVLKSDYFASYMKIDTTKHPYNEFANISQKKSKMFERYINTLNNGTVANVKIHPYTSNKTKEERQELFNLLNNDIKELKTKYFYTPTIADEICNLYEKQKKIKQDIFDCVNESMPQKGILDDILEQHFSHYIQCEKLPNKVIDEMQKNFKITDDNIDFILEVEVQRKEPTKMGDKFANLFAGKGTVSKILPDDLMPTDKNGDPVEVIFNPLGIFGRNNWGTMYELVISKLIRDVESTISNKHTTYHKINFIKNNFIKYLDDDDYFDLVYNLLKDWDNNYQLFKEDVIKNGFYLFVGNFPRITYHEFITNFIVPYEDRFSINLTKKETLTYSKELIKHMRQIKFTSNVFDDDSIYESTVECQIAENYFLKLYHTAASKYNAIAGATSFSISTGQMAKGKSINGGNHFSWQTKSAILDRKCQGDVLKEMLTIKADCTEDKNRMNEDIMMNGSFKMKDKYKSITKEVIDSALKMNGMRFYDPNEDWEQLETGSADRLGIDHCELSSLFDDIGDEDGSEEDTVK